MVPCDLLALLKITSTLVLLCCLNFVDLIDPCAYRPLPSFPSFVYLLLTWSSHKATDTCQSSWQAVSPKDELHVKHSHHHSWKIDGKCTQVVKQGFFQTITAYMFVFVFPIVQYWIIPFNVQGHKQIQTCAWPNSPFSALFFNVFLTLWWMSRPFMLHWYAKTFILCHF